MSESKEIAAHGGGAVAHHSSPYSGAIPMDQQIALIREALTNDKVNPANAREMMAIFREMQADARKSEFNSALIRAKAEMPAIFKRGKSDKHAYAKFEDMQRAVDPVLRRHNLTIDFRIGSEGNNITVQPILRHENGWLEEGGVMKGPPDQGPGRSAIQSIGSASSYLKRYSMIAMLNLVIDGEDNDGAIREDSLLNDRQEGVVINAQRAYDEGHYPEYFQRLGAKDKALLINSGHHARFTGGRALPGAQASQPVEEQRQDPPRDEKPRMTPEQQVDAYVTAVKAIGSLDDLREYQTDPRRAAWIEGIKAKHPDLHQRIIAANSERASALMGGAASEDTDLFGGDE